MPVLGVNIGRIGIVNGFDYLNRCNVFYTAVQSSPVSRMFEGGFVGVSLGPLQSFVECFPDAEIKQGRWR